MQLRESTVVAGQFRRFCVVGLLSLSFNNLLIVALTELVGLHYLVSIVLCFLIATAIGLIFNRHWSFQKDGITQGREIIRYFVVTFCGISLSLLATWFLMRRGVPYYVTMVGIASIMAPINFIAHKIWSFGLRFDFQNSERSQ